MLSSLSATEIILEYVCPSAGAVLATVMFAAPVRDLRRALLVGEGLGNLNPLPWAFMTGNCLGWVAYAYYTHDAFVLAGNMPGLILSIWLNMGAIKLQYHQQEETIKPNTAAAAAADADEQQQDDGAAAAAEQEAEEPVQYHRICNDDRVSSFSTEDLVLTRHERTFFYILLAWIVVLLWVGWIFPPLHPAHIVGLVVNVNLIFFYGGPLNSIFKVISQQNSDCIHRSTMIMTLTNTSFWLAYGIARHDAVIAVPNACGLFLGILQGLLCLCFPKSSRNTEGMEPVPLEEPLADWI